MTPEKVALGPQPLVYPMPAFLVGALVNGKPNFLTAAWGGIACSNPPMLTVALQHHRYTYRGIKENGTFSVNIPSTDLVIETDYCGVVSGSKVDKNTVCGFRIFSGKLGTAPMIEQCPVNLECKVFQVIDLGSHALIIGQIMETHVSRECMTAGQPDVAKIKPFAFTHGNPSNYQALGEVMAPAFKIGKQLKVG